MSAKITAVIVYKGSPEATRKALGEAVREALADIGRYWHGEILPKHFLSSATARYGYKRRGGRYTKRKRKKFGHRRPMVYTGRMQRDLRGRAEIRSSTRSARVKMRTARALNFSGRAKRGDYPDMKAEVTETTAAERLTLAKRVDVGVTHRLNAVKTRSTKTIT